jgi:hypothetical protein
MDAKPHPTQNPYKFFSISHTGPKTQNLTIAKKSRTPFG